VITHKHMPVIRTSKRQKAAFAAAAGESTIDKTTRRRNP
jgi:hypothetical protein